MRLTVLAACLVLAACGADASRVPPSTEELRLLAFLTHDGYVILEGTERDADGRLIALTRQGNVRRRYLLAPDDPSRPELRLRPLDDACTLETVRAERIGVNPLPR